MALFVFEYTMKKRHPVKIQPFLPTLKTIRKIVPAVFPREVLARDYSKVKFASICTYARERAIVFEPPPQITMSSLAGRSQYGIVYVAEAPDSGTALLIKIKLSSTMLLTLLLMVACVVLFTADAGGILDAGIRAAVIFLIAWSLLRMTRGKSAEFVDALCAVLCAGTPNLADK
jgi:hypothetical protein